MKAVYVLVSVEKDTYYEQFLISASSLRLRQPECKITVLTDDLTQKTFFGAREAIFQLADEIVCKDFPANVSGKQRSRWLKTSMRNILDGDFLFIDCDTIICEALGEITKYEADLYAVMDGHAKLTDNYFSGDILRRAKVMGYHAGFLDVHYNSGIMWIRDTQKNREFFELWHRLWKETCAEGYEIDQLSFNEANWRSGGHIQELDGVWNCQLELGVKYLAAAKIIHYNSFNGGVSAKGEFAFVYKLADSNVLKELKQNEEKIDLQIQKIIENPKAPEAFPSAKFVMVDSDDYKILQGAVISILRVMIRKTPRLYRLIDKAIRKMKAVYRHN